jgi:hypothetical protein
MPLYTRAAVARPEQNFRTKAWFALLLLSPSAASWTRDPHRATKRDKSLVRAFSSFPYRLRARFAGLPSPALMWAGATKKAARISELPS